MSTKPDRPEPEDFKAHARDVDVEATVTKLVGEEGVGAEARPSGSRVRVRAPEPEAPAAAAPRRRRSWLERLFKSLFK